MSLCPKVESEETEWTSDSVTNVYFWEFMLRDEQKFRQLWAIHAQVRHHIPTSTLGWLFVFSLWGGHINFRDQRWMQVNLENQRLAPVQAKRKSDESVPKGREWRDWIGFSIINHPFWGTPIFWNPQISPEIWCFKYFFAVQMTPPHTFLEA